MAGVNKAILIGNLGRDPEIMTMESGRKMAKFPLATTESYRDRNGERVESTEWHNIVFWGPIADVVEKYVKKGSKVYVEGRLKTRSYEDKEGVTKYITEIQGRELTMLDSRQQSEGYESGNSSAGAAKKEPVNTGIESGGETDDLPF